VGTASGGVKKKKAPTTLEEEQGLQGGKGFQVTKNRPSSHDKTGNAKSNYKKQAVATTAAPALWGITIDRQEEMKGAEKKSTKGSCQAASGRVTERSPP